MPGGLTTYAITGGKVVVKARSSIHDTTALWSKVAGSVGWDPGHPEAGTADVTVDMRVFDAGDRLKNWKLKGDLEPDKHPTATFKVTRLEQVTDAGGRTKASAVGTLAWRGKTTEIRASGEGTITPSTIDARATFDLDVRTLGVEPPKVLMFKVEPVVTVEVTLSARAG